MQELQCRYYSENYFCDEIIGPATAGPAGPPATPSYAL